MKLVRFQRPDVWSAFDQLTNLRDEFNRFFFEGARENGDSRAFNTWAPALDLYEDKENLVITAELPGLKKEDIDISLHENTITISGERRNEKKYEGSETSRSERFFGRFTRSLSLPKTVKTDAVKAAYKNGVLTVTLPKAEEAKPRQIAIQQS
jgi:HSP20 family protein